MTTLLALARELGVTVVPALALTDAHELLTVPVTPTARRARYLIPADPDDITPSVRVLLDIAHQASPTPTQATAGAP